MNARFDTSSEADFAAARLDQRQASKAIHRSRNAIMARLETEADERGDRDLMVIVDLSLDEVLAHRSHGDVLDNITAHTNAHGPGTVTELWGLRSAPGAPLAGAVVGYRLHDTQGDRT